jgi:ABC-type phosphonate transport system ATPase subunit
MFLFLEDGGVVLTEHVVALVRLEGETAITMRDGTVRVTGLTPRTLSRRGARFRNGAARRKEWRI